jgi:hypothetical protein
MKLENKIEDFNYQFMILNAKYLAFNIVDEIIKQLSKYNYKIKFDELKYIVSKNNFNINYKNIFNIKIYDNSDFYTSNFAFTIFFILNDEYSKDGFGKLESLDLMNDYNAIKIDAFKNKIYKIINDLEV